jgi:pyruvate/2-oxoglutarate dehydrogenase complex dihydrolipoamide acyltransferase (E2) component
VIQVQIPKMGMSTLEVEVVEVMAAVGDRLAAGAEILEVEAEKANLIIEAPSAGALVELKVAVGDVCEVGDVVAVMTEE